jgi:hypothetical protein
MRIEWFLFWAGLFAMLCSWAAYRDGKRAADRWYHGLQIIGYAEPHPGTCKVYAVSDKNPGQVTEMYVAIEGAGCK